MTSPLAKIAVEGVEILAKTDPALYNLLTQEYSQQAYTLSLVAASGIADPSVLACQGSIVTNITTEGYPGKRFHGGCEFVDQIEQLAIDRAKTAFKAQYANVQPHSGTSANEAVLFSVLKPGDTILGMELNCGGHLTHGSPVSISGNCFKAIGYGLNEQGLIDFEQVAGLSRKFKPNLIIAGASSYPRKIDFERFREIADEVGAYLLADISHIAGLVAAGEHPNPIDVAHFTTTSTVQTIGRASRWIDFDGKGFQPIVQERQIYVGGLHSTHGVSVFPRNPKFECDCRKSARIGNCKHRRIQSLGAEHSAIGRSFGRTSARPAIPHSDGRLGQSHDID